MLPIAQSLSPSSSDRSAESPSASPGRAPARPFPTPAAVPAPAALSVTVPLLPAGHHPSESSRSLPIVAAVRASSSSLSLSSALESGDGSLFDARGQRIPPSNIFNDSPPLRPAAAPQRVMSFFRASTFGGESPAAVHPLTLSTGEAAQHSLLPPPSAALSFGSSSSSGLMHAPNSFAVRQSTLLKQGTEASLELRRTATMAGGMGTQRGHRNSHRDGRTRRGCDAESLPPWFCVPGPLNRLLTCWSYVIIACALYDATTVPYRWAFWIQSDIAVDAYVAAFITLDAVSDVFFLVNIAVTLRTVLVDNGAFVAEQAAITRRYTHSVWFAIDMLSVCPLDLLQLIDLHIHPWVRVLKILRLIQVLHLIQSMEDDRTVTLVFRLIKLLFYTLMVSHYAACVKYHTLLASPADPEYAVLTDAGRSDFSKYLQTLYWALGTVTGRDDTNPPESFGDTAFTVVMMVVGVLWFAYIVASLEQFADSASNANSILQAKLKYVTDFMHAFHLPDELQARVKSYYSYLFSSTVKYENEQFLSKLPSALQTDLRVAFAATVIDKAELFAGAESGFLCYIVQFLRINVTIPSERICALHEHADRLFFIQDGEVEILIGPKLAQIATLRAGDYFGEYGFLSERRVRTSTARSTTYCTLFYLRYDDFERGLDLFPASRALIMAKAHEQRKRTLQQEQNLTGLDGNGKNNNKLKKLIQVEQTDLRQRAAQPTIDPNAVPYRVWFLVLAAATLYNAIVLPLRIGFMPDNASPALLFFDYLGDLVFVLDIAINFRLRYMEKGTEVRDVDAIRSRYLSSWFAVHVVGSVPLDLLMLYTGMQPLLRMNKWLRVVDMHTRVLAKMKDSNHWELLSLCYLLFNFLVISHFAACIYFAYTRFEAFGASFSAWLPPVQLDADNATVVYQYFYSQYYAMTLLAGIGRHVYPPTDYDVLLSVTLMLIGVFVISYLIGKVGHLIFQLDAAASEYKNEYNYVQSMLDYRKVDGAIAQRVNEYLRHIWTSQHGIDPNLALNGLPSQLKTEIMMYIPTHHSAELCSAALSTDLPPRALGLCSLLALLLLHRYICEDMIRSVPRFKTLDDAFIRALVSELTFVELPPGEWIFRQGQLGDSMYFISSGLAEIIFEGQTEVGVRASLAGRGSLVDNLKLKVIGAGSFFGEGALLREAHSAATPTRSASVRAQSKCQLLSLSKSSFERVMVSHPRFARKIRQLNEDRKNKLMTFVHTKTMLGSLAHTQSISNAPDAHAWLSAGEPLIQARSAEERRGILAMHSSSFEDPADAPTLMREQSQSDASNSVQGRARGTSAAAAALFAKVVSTAKRVAGSMLLPGQAPSSPPHRLAEARPAAISTIGLSATAPASALAGSSMQLRIPLSPTSPVSGSARSDVSATTAAVLDHEVSIVAMTRANAATGNAARSSPKSPSRSAVGAATATATTAAAAAAAPGGSVTPSASVSSRGAETLRGVRGGSIIDAMRVEEEDEEDDDGNAAHGQPQPHPLHSRQPSEKRSARRTDGIAVSPKTAAPPASDGISRAQAGAEDDPALGRESLSSAARANARSAGRSSLLFAGAGTLAMTLPRTSVPTASTGTEGDTDPARERIPSEPKRSSKHIGSSS